MSDTSGNLFEVLQKAIAVPETIADRFVEKQVNKLKPWIILLYVMVGITTVFTILNFIRIGNIK